MNATTTSKGKLRVVGQTLMALRRQELHSVPANRIKVAVKLLSPLLEAVEEDFSAILRKYASENNPGQFMVLPENREAFTEASSPLLDDEIELPKMKGISWDDLTLGDARISAQGAEILEEIGFLTGNPDPEPKQTKVPAAGGPDGAKDN